MDVQEKTEQEKNDIIIEYTNNKYKNKIACAIMVKNEMLRIEFTLRSLLGFVNKLIIYDTGSVDNTIPIIKSFCKQYKLSLYIKFGKFEDFSISRNVLLDFVDTVSNIDFVLLLDCNDELQNGPSLIKFCKNIDNDDSAFFLKQRWKASNFIDYYNIRLIRPKNGWRYKGCVHEYIESEGKSARIKVPDVIIFQDRTQDDNKSALRFNKDKELLLNEYNSDKKTPRTVYYLAQTFECLKETDNALYYYKDRLKYEGFFEEIYQAAYHIGMLMREQKRDFVDYSGYFLLALSVMHRAEPIVRIVEHYISTHSWYPAFFLLKEACSLNVPDCGLFVDIEMYNYYRWHLMGIIAYYVKEYEIGLNACTIAISQRNNELDKTNLKFYKNEIESKGNDMMRLKLL